MEIQTNSLYFGGVGGRERDCVARERRLFTEKGQRRSTCSPGGLAQQKAGVERANGRNAGVLGNTLANAAFLLLLFVFLPTL